MTRLKHLQIIACVIVACASGLSRVGEASKPGGDRFRDVAAIEKWAKQGYFGGALVKQYSKDGGELIVVTGQPTSGLLTTQLVVLSRAAGEAEYQVVVKSAVFMGHVKVRQEKDGLAADLGGTIVLYLPYDLASLHVHTGL